MADAGVRFDEGQPRAVSATVRARLVDLAQTAARAMSSRLRGVYPSRTGRLRAGVTLLQETTLARVQTTATHANVYEKGSPPRFRASGGSTGKMPRARVFIPLAVRTRRDLSRQQQAVLDETREIV